MADTLLYETALKKAMALCALRELCKSDIRQKLVSWGVNDNDSGKILSLLIKERFIDEERYSIAFVKDKFRYNKWGKVKICAALKVKNIPGETIARSLKVIDDVSYMEAVKTLISSHRKKIKAKNQYDLKGKLLRFGLSRGFESYLLYDLLNEIE